MVTPEDHEDAARIATAAGELLLRLRAEGAATGMDTKERRDVADRESHLLITRELAKSRPDDAVLSEEAKDDPARLESRRVWIVDPLDGTREFGEDGRTDWAVHVALVVDGNPVAGAVALPAQGVTLATGSPPPLPPPHGGAIRLVVSRTRPPALADALAKRLHAELVPMGSAGAKTMAIVQGAADVYAHGGGQYEWDSAAPIAVAAAAGLHVSRLDGSPLQYNQPNPWLPDLLVCRRELVEPVRDALAAEGV